MKRKAGAAPGSASGATAEGDLVKRLNDRFERERAEQDAQVRAYFARMPATLAALDAAAGGLVTFQLRAELLQAGSDQAEVSAIGERCYRDVLLPGSASLFGLVKVLSAAFNWTPASEFVLQPGGGRLPKEFEWCSVAGKAAPELRTAAAQKAVTLASVWLKQLAAVRYCAHAGRVYKVWCAGGAPRAKLRSASYQLLPRCVGGYGVAPSDCDLPMLFSAEVEVGRIPWGVSWEDICDLNDHLRAGRVGTKGCFPYHVSQEEVNRILYTAAATPAFRVSEDGAVVSVEPRCEEFRDVRSK